MLNVKPESVMQLQLSHKCSLKSRKFSETEQQKFWFFPALNKERNIWR